MLYTFILVIVAIIFITIRAKLIEKISLNYVLDNIDKFKLYYEENGNTAHYVYGVSYHMEMKSRYIGLNDISIYMRDSGLCIQYKLYGMLYSFSGSDISPTKRMEIVYKGENLMFDLLTKILYNNDIPLGRYFNHDKKWAFDVVCGDIPYINRLCITYKPYDNMPTYALYNANKPYIVFAYRNLEIKKQNHLADSSLILLL